MMFTFATNVLRLITNQDISYLIPSIRKFLDPVEASRDVPISMGSMLIKKTNNMKSKSNNIEKVKRPKKLDNLNSLRKNSLT